MYKTMAFISDAISIGYLRSHAVVFFCDHRNCFTSCLFSSADFFCFAYFAIVGIFHFSFWCFFLCPAFIWLSQQHHENLAWPMRAQVKKPKSQKNLFAFDMQISLVARTRKKSKSKLFSDIHSFIQPFIYSLMGQP